MKRCYVICEEISIIIPGYGIENRGPYRIATTWAVSEKQALNNYCFRSGRKPFEIIDGYDSATEKYLTARPYTVEDMEEDRAKP